MCGIAGIYRLDKTPLPAAAKEAVKIMCEQMVHRGPDASGIFQAGPVVFGHRRLSIIDLRGGAQPMQSQDHNVVITYNGELYNYRELACQLAQDGARFATDSDTEVILESYRKWGTRCVEHFEGMFAMAIFDAKQRSLFLARDRFGKKPLFYTIQNGCCYFASEISALSCLKELSLHLDQRAIVRFLAYEYVPGPETIYSEIQSLAPAHTLVVREHGLFCERYWDLPWPKTPKNDLRERCQHLFFLLQKAVQRRLVSDVPLGVFLSGGLDSSIVTALMAHSQTQPVKTFSIGFTEASYDESRYARLIAKTFGTDHHEEILSAEVCCDLLPKIIARMDVPMADASVAPTYLLSGVTRQSVTVALGGDGSDELWAGYENYAAMRLASFYNRWPACLRRGLIEPLSRHLPASQGYVNLRLAMQTFLNGAKAPDWLKIQRLLTSFAPHLLREILAPTFLSQMPGILRIDELFSSTKLEFFHWPEMSEAPALARAFHVYLRQYLPEDILVKVDRCSMLHSLEVRAPFLDRELAEFTSELPLSDKFQGLKGKWLLRKAVAKLLPKAIIHRNKRGFQIPVAAWLRGRLLPLVRELLEPRRLQEQGIFEPKAVSQLLEAHVTGGQDLRKQLWTIVVLELWLEAHAKQPAVHPW
ncbi:MAG: asparagine synthase (glutamine-hydrolyzing) [Desulfovibrio sp.]|nr:asparagine synthase (glutamine-hydrolyzing) [Desulfovibrio sp.]